MPKKKQTTKTRPAKKADKHAATRHFAGAKVGPHSPIIASPSHFSGNTSKMLGPGCAGPYMEDLPPGASAKPPQLTAKEALYGFVGWLTTRERPIILSAHHNAGAAAEAVKIFAEEYDLPDVRDDWPCCLKNMSNVAPDLTNDPALSPTQVAPPPPSRYDSVQAIIRQLSFHSLSAQNAILAQILDHTKESREAESAVNHEELTRRSDRGNDLHTAELELEKILSGDLLIVHV